MKLHLKYTSILLTSFLIVGCGFAEINKEQDAIRACFEQYKSAVLAVDGEKAYSYLDSRSKKGYDKFIIMCQEYDSAQLERESTREKALVLMTRTNISPDKIMSMDGKELFINTVVLNDLNVDYLAKMKPEKITIMNKQANMNIITKDGNVINDVFVFRKENGEWKVYMLGTIQTLADGIKKMMKDSGKTENETISDIMNGLRNQQLGGNSWIPSKKAVQAVQK
jgi:hypothetical protein